MAAIVKNSQEIYAVRTGIDVMGSELNDTIVNGAYPEDSLVGANSIDEYKGHDISIWSNEGKDVILNHGYNVAISGGTGDDSIRNFGSNVRINGDEGSDKFIISGASENNTITDFTDGEDELWFESGAVKAEIDTYYAKHSIVIKSAETGNTLVRLEGVTSGSSNKIVWYKDDGGTMTTNIDWLLANANIDSPSSDDTLPSVENVIYGTNGDDFIENNYDTSTKHSRDNVRIEALNGDDTIQNGGRELVDGIMWQGIITGGQNVIINGGVGNDSVYNYDTENVTINGGEGNDTINNYSSMLVLINGDSGDDSIQSRYGGYKVTINGGDGADTISIGYAGECLIEGGNGNDYIDNNLGTDNMTLDGGAGDDTIRNLEDLATIDGGAGNDSIGNIFGNTVSINGGSGNDTIYNVNATSNMTVNGGKGNDFISLSSDNKNNLVQYKSGDGKDTVTGFNDTSTLSISGSSYNSVISGNDVVIKIGDGSITLKDVAGGSPNIIGTYDKNIPVDDVDDTKTGKTQQDVIKAFMKALDEDQLSTSGKDLLDNAIAKASSGIFSSWSDVATSFLRDLDNAKSAEDFLRNICGFIPDNEDTGSITGFDVGSGKIKTDKSIVPEEGNAVQLDVEYKANLPAIKDTILLEGGNAVVENGILRFTKKGLTLIVEDYDQLVNDADIAKAKAENIRSNQERYAISKVSIINGLYTWWLEGALDLIAESYGKNISFDSNVNATVRQIKLMFDENNAIEASVSAPKLDDNGNCTELTLTINISNLGNVNLMNNKSGPRGTVSLLDRTLAHEFTHGTMAANIRYMIFLPVMIKEGTAEFTAGADGRCPGIEALFKEYKNASSDTIRAKTALGRILKDDNLLYSPSSDSFVKEQHYYIGYSLIKYFAKKCSNSDYVTRYIGNLKGTVTSKNGELVQANNGIVALDKGDAVSLDSAGNISTIFINDKEHIVTTPDSETSVDVRYGGKVISKVVGFSYVKIDEKGRFNISAKDNAVNVEITEDANKASILTSEYNDTIKIGCNNAKYYDYEGGGISIGGGDDTVTIQGSNNYIDANASENATSDKDNFIITAEARNNTIVGFLNIDDELWFEEEITAEVQGESVVITSTKTGDKIIVLDGVKSGSNNNLGYSKENGDTVRTSINNLISRAQEDTSKISLEINPVVLQEIRNNVVRASANVAENYTPTYIANDGEIIDSSQGAALKLEVVNNTLIQTALNSSSQIYSLGSANDSMDWIVNTNSGDDSITSASNKNSTINSGAGNDTVNVAGSGNVYVNSANGNDVVQINNAARGKTTVETGKGNDSINNNSSANVLLKYSAGDGNDFVTGFNANSTLSISGAKYSSTSNKNDVIFSIGSGNITLVGVENLSTLNVIGTPDTTSTDTTPADTTPADTTPPDTTPADTIPEDTIPVDTTPLDTTPANTNPSGQEQSDSVQIVKDITGLDINRLASIVLTNSSSIEEATSNGTKLLKILSDSGVMNVDLRDSDYRQIVSLEGGNQKVQFNDQNGNIAIVGESATGSKNIIFGNGDDLGIFYSPDANIRATVGSGRDSIITDNNARVRVDMTNSDEAKTIPYSGRIILDNYDSDSRAEIVIPDVSDITGAIKNNSIQLIGNEIRPNSSTRIQLSDSTDANIVNLSTERGDTQKVGFTGINGGAVDARELHENFLLKGNYAENTSDKQKRKPSTLVSGNGHDTILAGARDFVDGGNGKNQIFLTSYDLRQIKDGATIVSSGNGRNTVHGFHEGFGYDSDVIQVKDFNNLKFKFDTDGLLLTANDSRIKFDGIGITSATTDDSTNSLGTDRAELIQITNGSSTMRTAVAQTNQSILVQKDDYITPNAFFGNRSGLNFSEYSDSVEINLIDGTGKLGKWDATFKGINKLQAGDGMSTLIGDDTRNTLIAGTGYTSMWGGAGNDKLIGKGNSADKDGRTTFFFFAGDGRDVISDFTFLTPDNRYDGIDDIINVGNSDINDAYSAGNNVVVVFDQNSYLIIEDAVGKDFRIANMIAKVDRNLAYDGLANCYVASGGSSLTVDSTVKSAEIWLDNSHETQFFGNIRTLDASAMEGNTSLVGNEFDNTIIAGQGDSSLWGGFSQSNDLLIGGNSRNTFFYCMGNGNDTIQGTNDKDFVILSDVSLDQIIETSITADSVSIRFNDGGSLQIQGTSDVTYQLADGSKYSANHQRLEWDSR